MKFIKRGSNSKTLLILENNKVVKKDRKELVQGVPIGSAIRIQKKDFHYLKDMNYLNHFNLQQSKHKVGTTYLLPRIEKHGFHEHNKDKQPILNYDVAVKAECVGVKELMTYEDLSQEDLKDSFPHMRTVEDVKKEILYRYTKSMPELSKEEILSMGISLTRLKLHH